MRADSLLTVPTQARSSLCHGLFAALTLFAATGCSVGAQGAPPSGPIVVLSRPDNAAALGSMRLVVRDSVSYQRFWALAWAGYLTPPKAPTVDFSRDEVVVIAVGPQSITGGRIEITGFEDSGGARIYHVRLAVPGPGCIGGTAMTYNALFARVAKGSGVPLFRVPIFRDTLSSPPCN